MNIFENFRTFSALIQKFPHLQDHPNDTSLKAKRHCNLLINSVLEACTRSRDRTDTALLQLVFETSASTSSAIRALLTIITTPHVVIGGCPEIQAANVLILFLFTKKNLILNSRFLFVALRPRFGIMKTNGIKG
jgi:hypothetical protein